MLSTFQHYANIQRWIQKSLMCLRKNVVTFQIQDHFYRQNSKNVPIRQVVDDFIERKTIFQQLHDKSGHKRWESTY